LTVDPATIDPATTIPEQDQIFSLTAPATPVRMWDGLFVLPSVGGFRSVFGSLRAYNGGPYNSFHGGVDFSGAEDRPITAPAPGVVVFTGKLVVRGNATVIDHGWGVYTGYWHQSKTLVNIGDHVATGQILGYQGATGRVTGPHLHWEMIIGDKQVDPLQWTKVAFP
jgi:murein DD-endopeptidase MepM/ murein hydrolase activator NlpD